MDTHLEPPIDTRLSLLLTWLASLPSHYRLQFETLRPASNDASFRRYFRVNRLIEDQEEAPEPRSYIVMDAPPPMEDVRPFVRIAALFAQSGANFPEVFEAEIQLGFLLLEDFGSTTYLEVLAPDTQRALYGDAIAALIQLQGTSQPDVLPEYDETLLRRELDLFPNWYLAKHKKTTLDDTQRAALERCFRLLIDNNLAQAKVFVHRDYHSRNLMLLKGPGNPGILDFQDAVYGPISYDLVSLLRDAYISWDEQDVIDGCARYWEQARAQDLPVPSDFSVFYRDFEWMGLQRHLKVLGIFARLCYRDGKDRYLNDMPLVLEYVLRAAKRYQGMGPLVELIEKIEGQPSQVGYTF